VLYILLCVPSLLRNVFVCFTYSCVYNAFYDNNAPKQILRYIGKLESNQTVLIHAAASGVGTAMIQQCQLFGAKSIATAGQQEKLDFCKSLGASLAINYKTQKIGSEVKEWIKENQLKGVDLATDPVGATYFQDNMDGRL
jgi:tumor protein p53-inducible protein 3